MRGSEVSLHYPPCINTSLSAEIGCNHQGDMKTAKKMIRMVADAGWSVAKFQKRTPSTMPKEKFDKPYDNPHSFGKTYGEHRERLEFSADEHAELWNYCRMVGINYATSVWDVPAFDAVRSLSAPFIKIPSACNEDWELLRHVKDHWPTEVHISNGMTEPGVEDRWREMFGARLVVYVATSSYPCAFHDVNLADLLTLREGGIRPGLSGHHLGIAIDLGAAVMGAEWIERHVTLDRSMKGTDHAASLEPGALDKLSRDLSALAQSWNRRSGVLPCEQEAVKKLKVKREDRVHA